VRPTFLLFHVPDVGEAEIESVATVLRSGWMTSGPRVEQFETEFAKRVGAAHAVAVNSGTAALHLALLAAGVGSGDEVIVPTMTFAATSEAVLHVGARPVLVDCERATLNVDPLQVERAITSRTKAIIPVHFGGHPCAIDEILRMAQDRNLKVIEDAAHCFPARHRGRTVGTLGDITCFSFYATKTLTTGEGGMAVTASLECAERLRLLRLHGIRKNGLNDSVDDSWEYEIIQAGFKYNLTDIAAAIGLEQLKKCDKAWDARRKIANQYNEGFADFSEIQTPVSKPVDEPSWHLYVIQLDLDRLRIDRKGFIEALRRQNIGSSVHFIPLHLHALYRSKLGCRPEDFPAATFVANRILSLPIYPQLTQRDVGDVIEAVRGAVIRGRR
jgi:perosamine synthetase